MGTGARHEVHLTRTPKTPSWRAVCPPAAARAAHPPPHRSRPQKGSVNGNMATVFLARR